jgi:hypothetical protein
VARHAETIGHDERAEAGWKFETATVRIAHWSGLAVDEHEGKDTKCRCETSDSRPFVEQRHHESPVLSAYCTHARKPNPADVVSGFSLALQTFETLWHSGVQ